MDSKYQIYQLRMKRRPTRAERRFDLILQRALKGSELPDLKQTQVKTRRDKKKRKFLKQRIFEDTRHNKVYIVDFYIPKLKLAFEVDGPSHSGKWNKTYDAVRSSFLATRGIRVVRFTNEETLDSDACVVRVKEEVKNRIITLKQRQKYLTSSNKYHPKTVNSEDLTALTQEYLAGGGKITVCPTVGRKRRFFRPLSFK